MKIQIGNWGPIGKCELDLQKSLSIIYGDNNIGKSYAMQVVYLFLKKMLVYTSKPLVYYAGYKRYYQDDYRILQMISEFVDDKDVWEKNITDMLLELYARRLEKEWLSEWLDSLENTFGTFSRILEEKPYIRLEEEDGWCFIIYLQEQKIELCIPMKPVYLKKTSSDFHKSRNCKDRFDIYVYGNKVETSIQIIGEKEREIQKKFAEEISKITNYVYFLPASRSGIDTGMNSFGPILAQLSQNRASIKGKIQIPSIPEPISDYYMELSAVKSDGYKHFTELAAEIEGEILKGEVLYDNKKKNIIYNEKDTDYALEMSDVSSMVSEISPVTAYLKYIVKKERAVLNRQGVTRRTICPTSIIFIEEPEAHLYPKNQVELIKIFVKLIKQNVKLVMASHSNYVFNELNNLILGKELDIDMYAPVFMCRKGKKSFTEFYTTTEIEEKFDTAMYRFMQEEYKTIFLNDKYKYKDIKLYLITTANKAALKFPDYMTWLKIRNKINNRDTLELDRYQGAKLYCFRDKICRIEKEIPPNPLIHKIL